MAYALEMFLDSSSDGRIRTFWEELSARNIPALPEGDWARPHVTLAICPDIAAVDHKAMAEVCDITPFPARLSTYGQFLGAPGVLQIGVTPTRQLLDLHGRVHQLLEAGKTPCDALYVPDIWIPHCTLSVGMAPSDFATLVPVLQQLPQISAEIAEIAWVDVAAGKELPLSAPLG